MEENLTLHFFYTYWLIKPVTSFSRNLTKSGMNGSESGCDLGGGEGQAMMLAELLKFSFLQGIQGFWRKSMELEKNVTGRVRGFAMWV